MLQFNDIKIKAITEKEVNIFEENDNIAIIGMACRLPLSDKPIDFWDVLENGIDCVRPISAQRKADIENYYRKTNREMDTFGDAAYIDSIDVFDALYFNIPPKEAELMDPNQRLFLQVCWEAIEDAGYGGDCLKGSQMGVYVGHTGDSVYKDFVKASEPELMPIALSGNLKPFIGGRIAYLLDTKGPNMMIDTACSSSLVAIHEACNALNNKECELALAGGIQIHILPFLDVNIGVTSKDGRTRTFNEDSTGTGTGEGVISLLLKPLAKALQDGDNIHAVIKGSAVNYDGKSIGITAPNPQAQEDVILKACQKAHIEPTSIDYIEAHGTGTKLGDPIEVQGITNAFSHFTDKRGICAIGSVKTNIGHLDGCAGAAGILKCILALKAQKIPPTIHIHRPNPLIDFINSPLFINDKLMDWEKEVGCRICSVSSFGISGTNCHIILEEAPKSEKIVSINEYELLTISAEDEYTLKSLVKLYLDTIEHLSQKELANFCYTINIGRNHYKHRIAIIFESKTDLINKLNYIKKSNNIISERLLKLKGNSTICGKSEDDYKLLNIARSYNKGDKINWVDFYSGKKRYKMSVPVYPLKKNRYWVNMSVLNESEYFYRRKWEKTVGDSKDGPFFKSCLFIHNKNKEAIQLIKRLRNQGTKVVEAFVGKEYKIHKDIYEITLTEETFTSILKEKQEFDISNIIFSFNKNKNIDDIEKLTEWVDYDLRNLFLLIKLCQKIDAISRLSLLYYFNSQVKTEIFNLSEFESMASVCRVSNQECKKLKCNAICICNENNEIILKALHDYNLEKVIIKNNNIYQEKIKKLDIENLEYRKSPVNGKCFIILGGTGGIGQEISKYLNRKNNGCSIIWVCRNKDNRDASPTIEEIKRDGGTIDIYYSDLSDYNSFISILDTIIKKHGRIDSVFNTAGIAGVHMIENKDIEEFNGVIKPKIYSSWILNKIIKKYDIGNVVLFSSVSSIFGGIGQADYASANAFMDGLINDFDVEDEKIISLQWSGWKEVGMAHEKHTNIDTLFKILSTEQALYMFETILKKRINKVIVGSINYDFKLLKEDSKLKEFFDSEIIKNIETKNELPTNKSVLKELIEIYKKVLGFEEISLDDNFFEMGGNSIMVNKMFEIINKAYPNTITVTDLFSYPSIRKLASYISEKLYTEETSEEIEESIEAILKNVANDNISIEEALEKYRGMEG